MKAHLEFSLPEERGDFDAAIHGRDALTALWEIDQRMRSLLKHGDPTDEESALAEEVRAMIPRELMDI